MELKVGDTIQCADPDDLIENMLGYAAAGVETDFLYEKKMVSRGITSLSPVSKRRTWLKKRTLKIA